MFIQGFVLNWLNPYPPLPIWEIKILDFLVGNWTLDHLPPLLIWDILSNGGCGDVGGGGGDGCFEAEVGQVQGIYP